MTQRLGGSSARAPRISPGIAAKMSFNQLGQIDPPRLAISIELREQGFPRLQNGLALRRGRVGLRLPKQTASKFYGLADGQRGQAVRFLGRGAVSSNWNMARAAMYRAADRLLSLPTNRRLPDGLETDHRQPRPRR
jgi:hypothetical protein